MQASKTKVGPGNSMPGPHAALCEGADGPKQQRLCALPWHGCHAAIARLAFNLHMPNRNERAGQAYRIFDSLFLIHCCPCLSFMTLLAFLWLRHLGEGLMGCH